MQLGERLKEIRELNHKSQNEIAELLNTTQQQYWKYEKDKQEIPVRHIITLAKYYNITTDYLLGMEEKTDNISAEEHEIIKLYRALTEREKGRILERIQYLVLSTNQFYPEGGE